VDWVSGASMMLRREVLEDIGLFDETYFLYFEETDLCIRAHRAGWETWYLPESSVAHVGSVSTGYQDLEKRTPRYWFDSRRYYYLKNGGPAEFWKANAGFVFGSAVWRLRRLVQQKPRQDARGLLRDLIKHTAGLE
jgi:N-acetylglucosaminyl-diphospho-decaprenol L-rhamnosyltransferase